MTLYCVRNGWMGNSSVAALVEAENEEDALAKAEAAFKAESEGRLYADPASGSSWHERNERWTVEALQIPLVGEME